MDETNGIDWEALAEESRKDVERAIAELCALISHYDPIEILSRVATFVLTTLDDEHKDAGGPIKSETNLEYLVSLVAAHPETFNAEFPSPDVNQRVLELVTQVLMKATVYYSSRRHSRTETRTPIEELADSFRNVKIHVRGDGYWPHLRETMMGLLTPHADKLREVLGFSYQDYLAFMDRTESEIEARCSSEMRELGKRYRELMKPWFKSIAEDESESSAFQAFVSENRDEIDMAKANFDRIGTPSIYILNPTTEAEQKIVSSFSSEVGINRDFHGSKPAHAFWPLTPTCTDRCPILSRAGVHYAFNISKLQREAHNLIGDLLRDRDAQYWERKFLPDRDQYLERETARLFRTAFPGALVFENMVYPLSAGGEAEADIVIVVGGVLMVIECKAGRLDPSAWRGGEKRVLSDMKSTVASGLNQAQRLVSELTQRGTLKLTTKGRPVYTLESSQFKRVFSVNVTLELLSSAASTLWELEDAGLVADAARCWSVSLNDLRVIMEILNSPALLLHYLVRRLDTRLIRKVEASDELDYLMHYVDQGLFFRERNTPKQNEHITICRFTDALDQYYRRVQGVSTIGNKPRVSLGKNTARVIEILLQQRPCDWLIGCIEVLEFGIPTREELLGKLSSHLSILQQKKPPFALSFVANFESSSGIAVATSRTPAQVRELVIERCRQHCQEHNIDHLTLLLFGVPVSGAKCEVLSVERSGGTDSKQRLLQQLRFERLDAK